MACSRRVFIPLRDHNPRARFPVVTFAIIAVNVGVFLLTWSQLDLFATIAGAIPFEIVNHVDLPPRDLVSWPLTLWTSMFLHGGFMHLVGNMWFLWLFGDNVEEALGPVRYVIFYAVVGTVGALAQIFTMPASTVPMIGASGCVAGILGAYAMLYPHARVSTLIMIPLLWPVILVRAWIFLGLWFVGQFMLPTGSGVAWMAHVGGFLAGVGLARLLRRHAPAADAVQVEYLPPPRRRW
jgi:membrane associated rhomboid family serine protease